MVGIDNQDVEYISSLLSPEVKQVIAGLNEEKQKELMAYLRQNTDEQKIKRAEEVRSRLKNSFRYAVIKANGDEGVDVGNDSEWRMVLDYVDYHHDIKKLDIAICKLGNDKYSVTIKDLYHIDWKKSKIYKKEISADNSNDFCEILGKLLHDSIYFFDKDEIYDIFNNLHVYEVVNKKQPKELEGENLYENIGSLQTRIIETGKNIDWQGIRGNIEYNYETSSIKSRNGETVVESFNGNIMRLMGLDLDLSLEEGIWLANFKNWVDYMLNEKRKNATSERERYGYGENCQRQYTEPSFSVKYKSSIMNKKFAYKNTLYINDTMLITRKKLKEYIPATADEKIMKEIADWLKAL